MKIKALSALALGVGMVLALSVVPAHSRTDVLDPEPLPGWILFTSCRDRDCEVYKKRADGTGRAIQLTDNETWEAAPSWSPDGRRIAFMRGINSEIYTMRSDGSRERRRTNMRYHDGRQPSWSPDGKRIAYGSSNGDGGELRAVLLGREPGDQSLAWGEENATFGDPTWSPDWERIAFVDSSWGDEHMLLVPTHGSTQSGGDVEWVDLPMGSDPSNPTWSPDGEWIAYGATDYSYETGDDPATLDADLFLMSPDGTVGMRLEEEPSESIPGGWSPDGRYLSFASDRLGSWDIFVIDVMTREVTPIVTHPKNDWSPDWWGS
jgi:TolB protein